MDAITYAIPASTCGIYHLLREGRVMYVGQSRNVFQRVASWLGAAPGRFNAFRIYPCSASELNEQEREHIERHQPPMNRAGRTSRYMPYGSAGSRRPPRVVREFGSLRAFLDTQPYMIGRNVIAKCGLPLSSAELLALPGFPKPVHVCRGANSHGEYTRASWRRDDVLSWLDAALEAARPSAAA